jgi:hypothetical protein
MAITVTLYDTATGEFGPVISGQETIDLYVAQGWDYKEGRYGQFDFKVDLDTGDVVPRVKPAAELQANLWDRVKARRSEHEYNGCITPKGRVQTDLDSRTKISGAVQGALIANSLGAPFSIDWTMEDNSTATHDAAEMIALGMAVLTFVDACFVRARELRDLIDADGVTAEDLDAIDIESGWPT